MRARSRAARAIWVIIFGATAAYFEYGYTTSPYAGAVVFFAILAFAEAVNL